MKSPHFVAAVSRHPAERLRSPHRLKGWIEDTFVAYFEDTGARKFTPHKLRGTAMSHARRAKIDVEDASIFFGCNPETMRKHYLDIDETKVSDDVAERMRRKKGRGKGNDPTDKAA